MGSLDAGSIRSSLCISSRRGHLRQIVGGVLELAYYRAAGDGQAFPTRERHRVLDKVNRTELQISYCTCRSYTDFGIRMNHTQ